MEKQPDQQVPQGTEKIPGSRRSAETLNRIVATLAERPQGVSAQELCDEAAMAHDKAYSCLHRRLHWGMLVCRRGVEGGSVITRFWLTDEAADAFQFPATLRKSRWDEVVSLLGPDGADTHELAQAVGLAATPMAHECMLMHRAGIVFRVPDFSAYHRPVYRYFKTLEEAEAWQRVPGNSVEEKRRAHLAAARAARRVRDAEQRRQAREARPAKAPRAELPPKAPKPPKVKVSPKAKAKVRAPKPTKLRAARSKPAAVPAAVHAGEPIITDQTKITRIPARLGRYEVDGSRVLGGFGTMQIGHYDRPASNWAQALSEAA